MISLVPLSVLTVVNLLSVKSYGEFEFWFASIKVAAIIVFIAIGAAYVFGFGHAGSAVANLTANHGFLPFGAMSVFAAVPTVIFAVGGAEIATDYRGRVRRPGQERRRDDALGDPARDYVLRRLDVPDRLHRAVDEHRDRAFAVRRRTGNDAHPGAADIMNAIVLIAVLSALNSRAVCVVADSVPPRRTRRCAEVAAEADTPQGAASRGAAEQCRGLRGDRGGNRCRRRAACSFSS